MDTMSILPNNSTLLVGYDFTHGKDEDVLIVGIRVPEKDPRKPHATKILNVFKGEEAHKIFNMLTISKGSPKNGG